MVQGQLNADANILQMITQKGLHTSANKTVTVLVSIVHTHVDVENQLINIP